MTWTGARSDDSKMRWLLVALVLLVTACGLNSQGPWVDDDGRQLQGNEVIQYDGFASCDQERVVFLFFFGDTYAKDHLGRLGPLVSEVDGRPLSFELGGTLPNRRSQRASPTPDERSSSLTTVPTISTSDCRAARSNAGPAPRCLASNSDGSSALAVIPGDNTFGVDRHDRVLVPKTPEQRLDCFGGDV